MRKQAMMMTSTFPTSRSSSLTIRNGIKEMQGKKEVLINLEATLKRKINEFRELCLKEGELTGQLPLDYPLQPREPIPQVRRRITRSSGNIHEGTTKFLQPLTQTKPNPTTNNYNGTSNNSNNNFAVPSIPYSNVMFPSRPTSTNSSSSSTSTASSNTRSLNIHHLHHHPQLHQNQAFNNNDLQTNNRYLYHQQQQPQQQQQQKHFLNGSSNLQSVGTIRQSSSNGDLRCYSNNLHSKSNSNSVVPKNGITSGSHLSEKQLKPNMTRTDPGSKVTKTTATNGHTPAINPKNVVNIDGLTNIQTSYYEETKPFQMSDFYKYSSKHRHRVSPTDSTSDPPVVEDTMTNRFYNNNQQVKTTRQHQEDVSKTKNSLKFASYDDQIQASVKLIEKSGQKFMEATAKAIAGNPSLAERLKQYSN